MTVDEAVRAMGMIEALYDGSLWSAQKVAHLTETLISDPEQFWDEYLWVTEDNPYQTLARQLIDSGRVTPESTFGQMREIMQDSLAEVNPYKERSE